MGRIAELVLQFTQRAEELRVIAANVKDADARDAMLRWADDYDRIAARAFELKIFGSEPRNPAPSPEPGSAVLSNGGGAPGAGHDRGADDGDSHRLRGGIGDGDIEGMPELQRGGGQDGNIDAGAGGGPDRIEPGGGALEDQP